MPWHLGGEASSSGAWWMLLWLVIEPMALLLGTVILAGIFRRASASVRHQVLACGLAGVLALPILGASIPWKIPVLPSLDGGASTALRADPVESIPVVGIEVPPARAADVTGLDRSDADRGAVAVDVVSRLVDGFATGRLAGWLVFVWGIGFLVALARLEAGRLAARRMIRSAESLRSSDWLDPLERATARIGLRSSPRLVRSDAAMVPFTFGTRHPVVVLPAAAAAWGARRREAVLLHELAHIRRRDLVTLWIGRLASAVHWFNPVVRWAGGRLRMEGERACDDLVLGAGVRASEYAHHLLHIARAAGRRRALALTLPMARAGEIEGRILAILNSSVRRGGPTRRQAIALLGCTLGITVACAITEPVGPDATQQEIEKAESATGVVSAQELADTLTRGSDPVDRRRAAWALSRVGERVGVAALSAAVVRDPDAAVREMSAWALGQLAIPAAVPALGEMLRRETDADARYSALWALVEIGGEATIPAITEAFEDDRTWMRRRAVWAVGAMAPRRAPRELIAMLGDEDPDVRRASTWSLGRIADRSTVDALAGTLYGDPDGDVRRGALWALYRLGDAVPHSVIEPALADRDSIVRAWAAHTIARDAEWPWPWPWPIPRPRPTP